MQIWPHEFRNQLPLQKCNSYLLPEPHPNPRSPFGMSVTWSAIKCCKSVTMSVFGGFWVTDTDFNCLDLITVTDAVTDTD